MIQLVRAAYYPNFKNAEYCALSTDLTTLPTYLKNGDKIYVIDTGKKYIYNSASGEIVEEISGGSGGLDIFIAQFTESFVGDISCDKTYAEIYEVLSASNLILAFWGTTFAVGIIPSNSFGGAIQFDFASVDTVSDNLWMDTLLMTPDGITRTTRQCSLTVVS